MIYDLPNDKATAIAQVLADIGKTDLAAALENAAMPTGHVPLSFELYDDVGNTVEEVENAPADEAFHKMVRFLWLHGTDPEESRPQEGSIRFRPKPLESQDFYFTGYPPGPDHERAVREGYDFQCYRVNEWNHVFVIPGGQEIPDDNPGDWVLVRAIDSRTAIDRYEWAHAQWHAHEEQYPAWMYPEHASDYVVTAIEKDDLPEAYDPDQEKQYVR